ncbi:serine/threonine protein kinase [Stigmatella erecta]|uniref:Serine/threonine protein kinase n=1 Tax=Stigmatella erecta TaxID=83460 RepID=A0A1I0JCI2_9BACT|nr:serine/threonine-protein kinase [Stigmatella erecta]SEU07779.1 Serine/threonine protein kinase [Stigmatella erecta]
MDPTTIPFGDEVGPWRVVDYCGQGSYGIVYRVERMGREWEGSFALKMALHPLSPRFEREAELLARVDHPHVPRLHDRGWWTVHGGVAFPYLVMDWVDGWTLYEWGYRHSLTSRQALRLLAQVARALEAVHAAGGVHRDVKGENIMVRRDDAHAVLLDFGSCTYQGARQLTHHPPPPGTPQYQSPECVCFQWDTLRHPTAHYDSQPADDVYALGVTAYRLVVGKFPPVAMEMRETADGLLPFYPQVEAPAKQKNVSPELSRLILRMLSREPSKRGSAAQLAQALERAARRAGRRADQRIAPIEAKPHGGFAAWRAAWSPALSWWLPGVALGLMLGLSIGPKPWKTPLRTVLPMRLAQESRSIGREDGGSVGLADAAVPGAGSEESLEFVQEGILLDIPKKPLPGQSRPPCDKPEVEINEGCWVRLLDAAPPCGDRRYEWKGKCYKPTVDPPRPSTSDPP